MFGKILLDTQVAAVQCLGMKTFLKPARLARNTCLCQSVVGSKYGPVRHVVYNDPKRGKMSRIDAMFNLEATDSFIDHSKTEYLSAFADPFMYIREDMIKKIEDEFSKIIKDFA